MINKLILCSIISLIISITLLSCGDSKPILIGYTGQLTGKLSDLGIYGRNGAILATEIINQHGGIGGKRLRIIPIDDKNTAEGALQADNQLLNSGVVAIVGHMTSTQTLAVIPFINSNEIVLISPTSSTPKLSNIKDSFFRTMVENPIQSRELADYARSALDISSLVTISEYDNKSFSFTFRDGFKSEFEENGGKILQDIVYSSSNPDWNRIVDALSNLSPDAVLLTCSAHDAVLIVQRIRSSGLKVKVLSSAWAYTDTILNLGGHFAEGILFVIDYTADNPNPEFIKFREVYKKRFGKYPNFASAFSYDAVMALASGLKKTGGKRKGLVTALAPSPPIEGVVGTFQLNEYGDAVRNVFIVTVKNGEFRTIEMR